MAEQRRLHLREFGIGVVHTISTGNFQNMKIEARISFGIPVGIPIEEEKAYIAEGQTRLEELARETYAYQVAGHERLTEHQRKTQERKRLKEMNQRMTPDETHDEEGT